MFRCNNRIVNYQTRVEILDGVSSAVASSKITSSIGKEPSMMAFVNRKEGDLCARCPGGLTGASNMWELGLVSEIVESMVRGEERMKRVQEGMGWNDSTSSSCTIPNWLSLTPSRQNRILSGKLFVLLRRRYA